MTLLTEEQAKEKWCPFARYSSGLRGPSANRWKQNEPTPHALNPVSCRCIASECMAWRRGEPKREPTSQTTYTSIPVGYCGIAGQVQP